MDNYHARWLFPVDAPPIEGGVLGVADGVIVYVGPAGGAPGGRRIELGECIVAPGFVNSHTHLELTGFAGQLPTGSLWDWLAALLELQGRAEVDAQWSAGLKRGAELSLAAGVTCVADVSRTGLNASVLADSPIRKVCFLELISGARREPNDFPSLEAGLNRLLPAREPGRLMLGLSPHAPYTVTASDLAGLVKLAAGHGLPVTMHLLETHEEREWLAGLSGRLAGLLESVGSPCRTDRLAEPIVEELARRGLFRRRTLLAHVNYAGGDAIAALARHGAAVAYCPRAHAYFGHEHHPWREMLAAGVRVCIGTDSLASNQSLSILDELRWLHQQAAGVPAPRLLALGTLGGAMALGIADLLGSLSVGKAADFTAIGWDDRAPSEPSANLLEGEGRILGTWIAGRDVWSDGGAAGNVKLG